MYIIVKLSDVGSGEMPLVLVMPSHQTRIISEQNLWFKKSQIESLKLSKVMSDFETRPEEKVEEEGVEEDTVDDRPCKVCQLAP